MYVHCILYGDYAVSQIAYEKCQLMICTSSYSWFLCAPVASRRISIEATLTLLEAENREIRRKMRRKMRNVSCTYVYILNESYVGHAQKQSLLSLSTSSTVPTLIPVLGRSEQNDHLLSFEFITNCPSSPKEDSRSPFHQQRKTKILRSSIFEMFSSIGYTLDS